MKKFAIFLISATLLVCSFNLNAQTDGCQFRFVLSDPSGIGWPDGRGITVTVDDIEYGFVGLPWGIPSTEEILLLPSGLVNFSWTGGNLHYSSRYFEIYNSFDDLIYTSPDYLPGELFFTYQNECPECIPLTDFEGERFLTTFETDPPPRPPLTRRSRSFRL